MSENNTNNIEMEDISSTSVEYRAKKNPVQCVNLYVEFKTVPNFLKCVIA